MTQTALDSNLLQPTEESGGNPRLSVGVLTYNSARTLVLCLKAILGQGYPREALDIFIVDAGSTDNTLKLASNLGVQIYSEKGCTRGRGRNVCIEKAKSELLIMLDSDIVIPKGWLSMVENRFQDPSLTEVASPYFTPKPNSGLVQSVIYYLTSGWEIHASGALERENWVSE